MLKTIAKLICLGWCVVAAAQTDEILNTAEVMPYFEGCQEWNGQPEAKRRCSDAKLLNHIQEHIIYPREATENNVQGMVVASFVVDKNGWVSDPMLLQDIGYGCGEVVLNLIREMPRWEPAMNNGHPVSVRLTLPVYFSGANADDSSDQYILTWGKMNDFVVDKKKLLENCYERISIRDAYGNDCNITELEFIYKLQNKRRKVRSNGMVTPKVEKFLQKLDPGGTLTLKASIQVGVSSLNVLRSFSIVE